VRDRLEQLFERLNQHVLGAERSTQLLLTALLANGHVLIQGAPGIGKTSLASALARSMSASFARVQFTPDLLPSDILGYSMFNQQRGAFEFIPGPVFNNIVLADEINRTSPRIQSALLECMNEGQVTVDGVTRQLEAPFMVVATQNNIYSSGTYPLPEPQLDRFLLSINMTLPDLETQSKILQLHAANAKLGSDLTPLLRASEIAQMQAEVTQVAANERICRYIALICESVRKADGGKASLSARASIALLRASQAVAYLNNVKAVYPDHVKAVAGAVLGHRMVSKESKAGLEAEAVINSILRNVPVP
jgi:MoxR-like ATPase